MSQTDIRPLIAAMRARCNKATPGPWRAETPWASFSAIKDLGGRLVMAVAYPPDEPDAVPDEEKSANLALMASCRVDLSRALDALEILRAELDALRASICEEDDACIDNAMEAASAALRGEAK